MKKFIFRSISIVVAIYFLLCTGLYLFQERLLFFPQHLDKKYKFSFEVPFEEVSINAKDGKLLNGVLFKANSTKGLIFYLHGNAGSIESWGQVAKFYTDLDYDVFMLDYRGYGKSESTISSQEQLYGDVATAYHQVVKNYAEQNVIVLGYSIGTGLAANLAAQQHPKLLILQAPYYNLKDLMSYEYPLIPTFLLKYKFETNKALQHCKVPVAIFHGDDDRVIYYGSSLKLAQEFKPSDTLITLAGQGHNGFTENPVYRQNMSRILTN
jgi:pimeloyl-ACP methyl ester carboxylesterase